MNTIVRLLLILLMNTSMCHAQDALNLATKKLATTSYTWRKVIELSGGPASAMSPITGRHDGKQSTMLEQQFEQETVQVCRTKGSAATKGAHGWRSVAEASGKDAKDAAVRDLVNSPLPHKELTLLLGSITSPQKADDGSVWAEVSQATGLQLAKAAMSHRIPAAAAKALKCEGCRVQVWLKDGVLTKYQVTTSIKFSLGLISKQMKRISTVTFSGVGTTGVPIPAAALKVLNQLYKERQLP